MELRSNPGGTAAVYVAGSARRALGGTIQVVPGRGAFAADDDEPVVARPLEEVEMNVARGSPGEGDRHVDVERHGYQTPAAVRAAQLAPLPAAA